MSHIQQFEAYPTFLCYPLSLPRKLINTCRLKFYRGDFRRLVTLDAKFTSFETLTKRYLLTNQLNKVQAIFPELFPKAPRQQKIDFSEVETLIKSTNEIKISDLAQSFVASTPSNNLLSESIIPLLSSILLQVGKYTDFQNSLFSQIKDSLEDDLLENLLSEALRLLPNPLINKNASNNLEFEHNTQVYAGDTIVYYPLHSTSKPTNFNPVCHSPDCKLPENFNPKLLKTFIQWIILKYQFTSGLNHSSLTFKTRSNIS